MQTSQLRAIISDKNEERERAALRDAANLIELIAMEQSKIACCNQRIDELRKELTALEVQQIDPATILGE